MGSKGNNLFQTFQIFLNLISSIRVFFFLIRKYCRIEEHIFFIIRLLTENTVGNNEWREVTGGCSLGTDVQDCHIQQCERWTTERHLQEELADDAEGYLTVKCLGFFPPVLLRYNQQHCIRLRCTA